MHGITRPGRSHPQLVRFTRALAATGAAVLVPDVPEWRKLDLAPTLTRPTILRAIQAFDGMSDVRTEGYGLIGFSFGAPHTIAAMADPAIRDRVLGAIGFGGYCHLESTINFMFTGEHEYGGQSHTLRPDPYGRWIVAANYLTSVPGYEDAGDVAGNWQASLCAAASSPGSEACFPEAGDPASLVISEVMANPLDEGTGEFVELRNVAALAIDLDGAGPGKAYDPLPWVDPTGTLWIAWHDSRDQGAWTVTTTEPDSADPTWSEPRRITKGVMMNKPTVLSTGEWLFPVVQRITGKVTHLRAVISRDRGATFIDKGALEVSYEFKPIEPMVVERRDGSFWMLVRTSYGIGESVSRDGGVTWSPLTPSAIKHCTSRFFITRLQSGHLLLVKHGPIDVRTEGPTQRRELTAYISKDDGATWSGGLMLDERAPVSYPDGQQTPDGVIRIIWDYHRGRAQEILTTHFTEADVLAGSAAAAEKVTSNRRLVSKGGTP